MKWQQLKALIWLRYRLFMVQFRKMKFGVKIILGLLIAFVVISTLFGGLTTFLATYWGMPPDKPVFALLAWDGIAGLFLIVWMVGFVSELQRAEPISIENLLHLPMSVRGAFLMNYISSFASLTVVTMLPAMIGVCLAMPFVYGWKVSIVFPLLFGFLMLTTALTFQIRGWLARMMSNPRRRQAIIAVIFFGFIGLCQLPGLLSAWFENYKDKPDAAEVAQQDADSAPAPVTDTTETESADNSDDQSGEIAKSPSEDEDGDDDLTEAEKLAERQMLKEEIELANQKGENSKAKALGWLTFAHRLIPFAWLPLGTYRAAEGSLWPGILGLLGMLGLGSISLAMSYRATIRFYRRAQKTNKKTSESKAVKTVKNAIRKPFPWMPLTTGTIARTSLTSMLRSHAVKMQLVVPYLVMPLVVMPLWRKKDTLPEWAAPLIGLGLVFFCIFMLFGFCMNIFGFDRHGFRSYVLMPIKRRDLLIAKNASLVPIVMSQWGIALVVVMVLFPLKWYDLIACVAQMIAAYMLYCVMGNFVSTMFAFPVPTSAMKRVQPRWQAILAQMFAFMMSPFMMLPVALPPLIDIGLRQTKIWSGFSINLPLSLVVAALSIGFYWLLLDPAAKLLWEKQRDVLLEVSRSE